MWRELGEWTSRNAERAERKERDSKVEKIFRGEVRDTRGPKSGPG